MLEGRTGPFRAMMKKLAVATYATKGYLYAWPQCVNRIVAATVHYGGGDFIFCSDKSDEGARARDYLQHSLPGNWRVHFLQHDFGEVNDLERDTKSNIRIAILHGAAFAFARKIKADLLFSVEADVLITPDSLRCLEWALEMPQADGSSIYDVAAGTYPNNGPLLGFGTLQNQIAKDFYPHERALPKRFRLVWTKNELAKKALGPETPAKVVEKTVKRYHRLEAKAEKYPPDGSIWEVIAKYGWRRRGWLDHAMPGSTAHVFHTNWCGLGVTLMNKKAMAMATFDGYIGNTTSDLFLCWERWFRAGVKIAGVPHVYCDHVKRRLIKEGDKEVTKFEHMVAYRETEGEYIGHMRVKSQPWL